MPFNRPPITEIIQKNEAEINSRLLGADARLRRSLLNILARVNAGAEHSFYGHLDFIFKQCFPDTAEKEYLERWASIWGIFRRPATKAKGEITVTGSDGATIPLGAELRRSDNLAFVTKESGLIASGSATIPIEAVIEGQDGNTSPSSELSYVSTPSNVDSTTITTGLTGGEPIESDESLLKRLLNRIQLPPHGGAAFDYVTWALEVPGVTRAWVYPQELGIGTVTVRFMMDNTYPDGIPQAGDIQAVQDYIEEQRPVTADVYVVAPIPVSLDLDIQLNIQDSPEIRTNIEAEVKAMIQRDAEPGGTLYLSRLNEAISIAPGEFDHVLVNPSVSVTHNAGEIAIPGNITFL